MLCALSENPLQLMALRSLAGLGLGGALSTATALTASNAPIQRRRATVTRMFLGFPIGAIVGGAVTVKIMAYIGWRGVFIGGGVCALLLAPLVAAAVTESPAGAPHTERVHSLHPLTELGAGRSTWTTALFCACVFLMLLTSYFLVSWIPTVLTLNGLSPAHAAMAAVFLNCGGVAGSLLLSFVVGRTTPLAPVIVCLCAGAVLIGAARAERRDAPAYELHFSVRRGIADHRCARRHPGAVRVFVSPLRLCDRRRIVRCLGAGWDPFWVP